tara:strand:- start:10127 stop:13675 length:3549 start_codon:yes stop_codon:yes gene_type:complete
MSADGKKLSNPFSTGSGGPHFEAHIQANFVTLMLSGGYIPCLPCWPVVEIKLQGKIAGYDTDDVIVFVEEPNSKERRKLLGQIKHTINITKTDPVFSEVMKAAWSDFNNEKVFTRGKDVIALITGPISATDTQSVRWLLEHARQTKDAIEFVFQVNQANFSSDKNRDKLEAFRVQLTKANDDKDISDQQLFEFLKCFHFLGYDLGKEIGVVVSLLHSHISQFNRTYPEMVWSRVVDVVQSWNQSAGTITLENLPENLIKEFAKPLVSHIPKELVKEEIIVAVEDTDWNSHSSAQALVVACLVGGWDEKNENDMALISELAGQAYLDWIVGIREVLHVHVSPLILKDGVWKVSDRKLLFDALASRIFDEQLTSLKELSVRVLTEPDPAFELPTQERYAAQIHGKVTKFSSLLRTSLANSLALIGSHSEHLSNCSKGYAETITYQALSEIFENSDWVLWGSLNNALPALAEAAPERFLDILEALVSKKPCPFDELFNQEGSGLFGANYQTGLWWALECLAWEPNLLIRVCVLFSEFATHDPGGNWANRPINSLTEILLPWRLHTTSSIEKRKTAVKTINNEQPDIGWELIISLFPNQHQSSTGTHKPEWRNTIPLDFKETVTHGDFWEFSTFVTELAIEQSIGNEKRQSKLVNLMPNMPKESINNFLAILNTETLLTASEESRLEVWEALSRLVAKHRYFSDAKWSLEEELLSSISATADHLAPSDPFFRFQYLFSHRDYDLFREEENHELQSKKIQEARQDAINQILESGGFARLADFANQIDQPSKLGSSIGKAGIDFDEEILPNYLNLSNKVKWYLVRSYIWGRHHIYGWEWVDGLNLDGWSAKQKALLLTALPFCPETWLRVDSWLNDDEREYWINTEAYSYETDEPLDLAIDKLIQYERPHAAIGCFRRLSNSKLEINTSLATKALLSAVSSESESNDLDQYAVEELIKELQENEQTDQDELFRIEWAYLPLLTRESETNPKLLQSRLNSDPNFFCELIQLMYRSRNEEATKEEPDKHRQNLATNAYRLLDSWDTVPGTKIDGTFDSETFKNWFAQTIEVCRETGHLDVALISIGKQFVYTPEDPGGLWMHKTIADKLNARDNDPLRRGYTSGIFNSRGVHWVDPEAKPELELAEEFSQKSDIIENEGYQRIAQLLRTVAEDYRRQAERIINEHKDNSL